MGKYALGDYSEIKLNFYTGAKFFRAGTNFPQPNLKEKVKEFIRENDKIIVIGESHTRCSIVTSNIRLDKVQLILKDFIGIAIGDIENIKIG